MGGFLGGHRFYRLFTFRVKSFHVELVCSCRPGKSPDAKQENPNPMSSRFVPFLVVAVALVFAGIVTADAVSVDPALKPYEAGAAVSGNIKSVGSDTMNNLMTLWAEGFKALYPNVAVEIEGKGSSTAPPALIEGTATFGPMSRKMKSKEVDKFEAAVGL